MSRWSWTQFTCAFLFTGFLAFLDIDPSWGLAAHLGKCLIAASVFGVLAGRFGDAAWLMLVKLFRWM